MLRELPYPVPAEQVCGFCRSPRRAGGNGDTPRRAETGSAGGRCLILSRQSGPVAFAVPRAGPVGAATRRAGPKPALPAGVALSCPGRAGLWFLPFPTPGRWERRHAAPGRNRLCRREMPYPVPAERACGFCRSPRRAGGSGDTPRRAGGDGDTPRRAGGNGDTPRLIIGKERDKIGILCFVAEGKKMENP